jgi:hypothetical protein
MQADERSRRVAVVSDDLVNAHAGGFDVLAVLEQAGWGAIVLPPAWYPAELSANLLTQFAEHIEEFLRHGYDVVCVGSCEGLSEPLAALGVSMPESRTPSRAEELSEFLDQRAMPAHG